MFKTVEDLKSFIIWAKKEKVAILKVDNVEIHMSSLAFLDDIPSHIPNTVKTPETDTVPSTVEQYKQYGGMSKEDYDLLMASAQG